MAVVCRLDLALTQRGTTVVQSTREQLTARSRPAGQAASRPGLSSKMEPLFTLVVCDPSHLLTADVHPSSLQMKCFTKVPKL